MESAITVAVIAAAASAIGWIVNYVLSSISERERNRLASRLSHIQKQLELLYGPLAFLMFEGRRSFIDLLETLGRKYVFINDRELPQDELELWLFWVDHEFIPRNIAVKGLLSAHTDLIVGNQLPESYIKFLDHHNSWSIAHQRWKEQGVPYAWHSKVNWPREFEDEVISTFEQLMKEHAELIGTIGGTESNSSKATFLHPLIH